MIFKKERDDAWITGISWIIRYCLLVISHEACYRDRSYEKGKKHTERYYIGVKNRATESEYSIKK